MVVTRLMACEYGVRKKEKTGFAGNAFNYESDIRVDCRWTGPNGSKDRNGQAMMDCSLQTCDAIYVGPRSHATTSRDMSASSPTPPYDTHDSKPAIPSIQ